LLGRDFGLTDDAKERLELAFVGPEPTLELPYDRLLLVGDLLQRVN
jgi:hypothetical protein